MSSELGCAQNPDGTLKDASEIKFTHSRSASPVLLSTPPPASFPTDASAASATLTPIEEAPKKSSIGKASKPKVYGKRTDITAPPKQRHRYTTGDKLAVLEFMAGPGKAMKDKDVIAHFRKQYPKLNLSMISKWRKQHPELTAAVQENPLQVFFKKSGVSQGVKFPKLEEMLVLFVRTAQGRLKISEELLRIKGKHYMEMLGIPENEKLALSRGWYEAFKERNGIREYKLHGEAASVSLEAVQAARERLSAKLASFNRRDIYNFDETGLFYRMPPNRTLATQQLSGGKGDKTRISLGFIANADGSDIRAPLFIGHAKKPRCFNKKEGKDLGFIYFHNKKAWMTGNVFALFLDDLNQDMLHQKRKICLTVDNAPSHIFDASKLTNVEVVFLDPNMTSHIQPMDAGIIRAFKAHYRRLFILQALQRYDSGEDNLYFIDQLQAMYMVLEAWEQITPKTVVNCWKHAGILDAFSIPVDPATNNDSGINQAVTELAGALKELSVHSVAAKDVPSIDELLDVEAEKVTEAEWTDAEILEQVEINSREESGEDIPELEEPGPDPEPLISLPEALRALSKLNHLFLSEIGPEYAEARSLFPKLSREIQKRVASSLKQTNISSFLTENH